MPLTDDQLDRYARHIVLKEVGGAGQAKLLNARVLVVGAGGLGTPLLMYLAAAGVGTIGVVDDDTVSLSNLQRQIIHDTTSVGLPKTASARATLHRLNPDVHFIPHAQRLVEANAAEILADYDVVADGSDNFETRFLVNDTCVALKKTLVSGAVLQFDGQVATFKPHMTTPNGGHFPCYRCFTPEAPPPGSAPPCAEAGILGTLAGVIGSLQATEVLKEILGIGETLAGRLLLYDGLSTRVRVVTLPADPQCPVCGTGRPPA